MAEKIAELDLVTAGKLFGDMTGSSTSSSFPESYLTTSVISVDSFTSLEELRGAHGYVRYQHDGISEAGNTVKADDDNAKITKTIGKYLSIGNHPAHPVFSLLTFSSRISQHRSTRRQARTPPRSSLTTATPRERRPRPCWIVHP